MKKVNVVLTGVVVAIVNLIIYASLFCRVVVAIVNLIIYASLFCGGVYFILWALKHFNIIGS